MNLKGKLEAGGFVVCGELSPPRNQNAQIVRRRLAYYNGFVDAINTTDNQTAVVRMSSIAAATIVQSEGGEAIMQMTCRDRNRIGIQSDLLGASAMGIHNVLCLTGDHQKFGDNPEARGVFDLDSIQLIALVSQMNEGYLLSGHKMNQPTQFFIGGAANPFAKPLDMRVIRLEKKIAAGAQFIQTQPVLDIDLFKIWMERIIDKGLHEKAAIIPGVMLFRSSAPLIHIRDHVPGLHASDKLIKRVEAAVDPEAEGLKIAREIVGTLREIEGIRGIHLLPINNHQIIPQFLKDLDLQPVQDEAP